MASEVVYAVRCHRCSFVNEVVPVRETDKKEFDCSQCGAKLPYPLTKYNPYHWRKAFVTFTWN
ncbi:MAG: hypothetical protein ACM3YO_02625 [Bacteroidota bacterium]